jgi:serine/threonine protein kinase
MQANVLMDEDLQPRLADFGLAILVDSHAIGGMTSLGQGGSCRWMAPELHDPERFGYSHFPRSFKSDVYSFAMLCLEASVAESFQSRLRLAHRTRI